MASIDGELGAGEEEQSLSELSLLMLSDWEAPTQWEEDDSHLQDYTL